MSERWKRVSGASPEAVITERSSAKPPTSAGTDRAGVRKSKSATASSMSRSSSVSCEAVSRVTISSRSAGSPPKPVSRPSKNDGASAVSPPSVPPRVRLAARTAFWAVVLLQGGRVETFVAVASASGAHPARGLGALEGESPAGPPLVGVAQPGALLGRVHLHVHRLIDPHAAPERPGHPPRTEALVAELAREAGRIRRRRNRLRRQQPRRVVVAVPVARRPVEAAHDDERAVETDDPDHVLQHRLPVPAAVRLLDGLRVAVVDRRREVEVVEAVVAPGEDEFARPDEAESVEKLGADGVRARLAAVEAEEGGARAPPPAREREHAGVLVVGVCGHVQEARGRRQLAKAVPRPRRAPVRVQPLPRDRHRKGEDAIKPGARGRRLPRRRGRTREHGRGRHRKDDAESDLLGSAHRSSSWRRVAPGIVPANRRWSKGKPSPNRPPKPPPRVPRTTAPDPRTAPP